MKLKQIVLMSITALSLSGSLYGMQFGEGGILLYFNGMENITCDNPKEFFDLILNYNKEAARKIAAIVRRNPAIVNVIDPNSMDNETALDYAITRNKPELLEILLRSSEVNVNVPGKNLLCTAITMDNTKQIIHLLCSAGAMYSGDNQPYQPYYYFYYKEDPQDALDLAETYRDDKIVTIIRNHIHSRLAKAIFNDNVDEVRRLITKYDIDINQALPSYEPNLFNTLEKSPNLSSFIPLHDAVNFEKNDVARLLINDLNANVSIQNAQGQTALHHELNTEIAQLLIAKGCDINLADNNGKKPVDCISDWAFTPEGLQELGEERVANFRALKQIFEGRPYIPGNNPPVIGNNAFSWKWIGGGVVVVVAVVAAKKLYNWWYKDTEVAKEKTEADAGAAEHSESGQETAKDKTAA